MSTTRSNRSVFSWRAILIAPLIVPVLASVLVTANTEIRSPWLGFLLFAAAGSVISYGATICLLLPALIVLRSRMAITTIRATGLGALLGAGLLMPVTWMSWQASGPDSGPPEETLFEYAARELVDPLNLFFPAAGAFTAGLYWLLLPRRRAAVGA